MTISLHGKNKADGKPEAPVTLNDLTEAFSQLSTYIGKKDEKSYWDSEPFLKLMLPIWRKWQIQTESMAKSYQVLHSACQAHTSRRGNP
jgi:hypothetical protein